MVRVDIEAEARPGRPGQTLEHIFGHLDHGPALFADQMPVSERSQMIGGRTMAEVRVDHHPEALELIEITINRRQVDVRRPAMDLLRELLGGPVARGVEESMEQKPARAGDPTAVSPEKFQHFLDRPGRRARLGTLAHLDHGRPLIMVGRDGRARQTCRGPYFLLDPVATSTQIA